MVATAIVARCQFQSIVILYGVSIFQKNLIVEPNNNITYSVAVDDTNVAIGAYYNDKICNETNILQYPILAILQYILSIL